MLAGIYTILPYNLALFKKNGVDLLRNLIIKFLNSPIFGFINVFLPEPLHFRLKKTKIHRTLIWVPLQTKMKILRTYN